MNFGLQNFLITRPVPSRYPKFLSLPDPIPSRSKKPLPVSLWPSHLQVIACIWSIQQEIRSRIEGMKRKWRLSSVGFNLIFYKKFLILCSHISLAAECSSFAISLCEDVSPLMALQEACHGSWVILCFIMLQLYYYSTFVRGMASYIYIIPRNILCLK